MHRPHRKLTWSKRISVWLSVLSVVAISIGAYAEYERLRETNDTVVYGTPHESAYRLKSAHWLFDRYQKVLLSDDEVGLGKLPAPNVNDLLVFKLKKFLLLCLASALVIWTICLSSGWFLKGFTRQKHET